MSIEGTKYSYKELNYSEQEFCNPNFDYATICAPICKDKDNCPDDCYAYGYEENFSGCICREAYWSAPKYSCPKNLRECLDPEFPHDRGWTAILLSGKMPKEQKIEDSVDVSNMVIYQSLVTKNCFVVNDSTSTVIDSVGKNRAFFKQRHMQKSILEGNE
jgi:hypothetical protein